MQPQSSSHYLPAQENACSGECASSKNLHDRQQQSVTSAHRSTTDQRAPSVLLTEQTPHSTSKGEVESLKSSLYSILLNNLSLLRCRCLRCHGYLESDKRRATEASDWSLLISAAYQHPRMSYRPRELIDCYYMSFNTPT